MKNKKKGNNLMILLLIKFVSILLSGIFLFIIRNSHARPAKISIFEAYNLMNSRRTYLYSFLILVLFSCKKENAFDCFKSTGKAISVIRDVGNFKKIEVTDKINVTIFKGSDFKVEVVAGENIIKNILTKVSDGVLKIDNINKCNFVRGYKREINVNITVPYIELVSNIGVGTLKFAEDFSQDTLLLRIEDSGDIYVNGTFNEIRTSTHGDGDMYFSGTANSLFVYTNGTNFIRAQNLAVKDYIFIETLSIGDCFINGSGLKKFDYHIESNGNIYYSNQPGEINNVGKADDNFKGRAIKKE